MELNTINNTGSWGDAAARLNENFSKVNAEVEKARLASSKTRDCSGALRVCARLIRHPRSVTGPLWGTAFPDRSTAVPRPAPGPIPGRRVAVATSTSTPI